MHTHVTHTYTEKKKKSGRSLVSLFSAAPLFSSLLGRFTIVRLEEKKNEFFSFVFWEKQSKNKKTGVERGLVLDNAHDSAVAAAANLSLCLCLCLYVALPAPCSRKLYVPATRNADVGCGRVNVNAGTTGSLARLRN